MAVSANSAFQLNRNDLIRRAFQLAGVLPAEQQPSSDDYQMASDFMNLELDSIQAEGVILRSVTRATLALVSGTAAYTLPATVLDVLDPAAVLIGSGPTEIPVQLCDRSRWVTLTDKTIKGVPTFMLIERGASITLTLWPIPSATMTLTYLKVGFLSDSDTAEVDTDFNRHWHKAIMFAVASHVALARNQDLAKVGFLTGQAEKLKRQSRGFDQEHGHFQMRPSSGGCGFGRW